MDETIVVVPVVLTSVHFYRRNAPSVGSVVVRNVGSGDIVYAVVAADEDDIVVCAFRINIPDMDVVGVLAELAPAVVERAGWASQFDRAHLQPGRAGVAHGHGVICRRTRKVIDINMVGAELHVDAVSVFPRRVVFNVMDGAVTASGKADAPGDVLVDLEPGNLKAGTSGEKDCVTAPSRLRNA